ncbi:MAG: cytochrome D1 domain-containing protein, partial [Acidobacteriota bacterium]
MGPFARVCSLLLVLVVLPLHRGGAATLVVLNKAEATASLIDLDTGDVVATIATGVGPHEAATSPDGRFVLSSNYGTREEPGSSLTLIDVPAAQAIRTIDLGEYRRPHGVQWLPDGKRALVTAEEDKTVLVVDVEAAQVVGAMATDQEISHMLAIAPDGSRAFVANIGSGSVTVLDLVQAERIATLETGEGAEGIAITPDGAEVWVTNRAADTISVVDAQSLEIESTLVSEAFPIRAQVTPDGKYVLISNARSAELAVFEAKSKKEVRRISMQKGSVDREGKLFGDQFGDSSIPIGILMDPSGERAWVALAGSDLIAEIDIGTWSVTR